MSTFYIDLLSIFFLFLTSLTCLFAMFGRYGLYWILPWVASTILGLIRLFRLLAPDAQFEMVTGEDFYIQMLTPVALLALFLSSLLLRYGISKRSANDNRRVPEDYHEKSMAYESAQQQAVARPATLSREMQALFDSVIEKTTNEVPQTVHSAFIYLLGIKHSGKSTLGSLASRRLKLPFFDLDELIGDLFSGTPLENTSIREIYRLFGSQRFRELEQAAIRAFFTFSEHTYIPGEQEHIIIALGGGVSDNPKLLSLLQETGVLVYLALPEKELFDRIMHDGIPPFLDEEDPAGSFHQLYTRRDEIYRSQADEVLSLSSTATEQENAELVVEKLRSLIIRGGKNDR
ncbi:MAG: shikimate kinase [Spirochaetota bacterium]